jgi:hypothetical protein
MYRRAYTDNLRAALERTVDELSDAIADLRTKADVHAMPTARTVAGRLERTVASIMADYANGDDTRGPAFSTLLPADRCATCNRAAHHPGDPIGRHGHAFAPKSGADKSQLHRDCVGHAQTGEHGLICDGCWTLAERLWGPDRLTSTLAGYIADVGTDARA